MDRIWFTIMTLFFIILSLSGILNFDNFFKCYCKLMNSRNSLNINYSKGIYAKIVLKLTLVITLLIGIIGFICNVLIFLKISHV